MLYLGEQTAAHRYPAAIEAGHATSYRILAITKELRIRKGPGTNYGIAQIAIAPGVYTIVAESSGAGSTKGWGKLKSGAGWISLDYATKV